MKIRNKKTGDGMEHKLDVGKGRFRKGIMFYVSIFDLEIALCIGNTLGIDIKNE